MPDSARHRIVTTGLDLAEGTLEAIFRLHVRNDPPRLFYLGDTPVRVEPHPDDGRPVTRELTEARVVNELAETIEWVTAKERPTSPRVAIARNILASPELPFPQLQRIVEVPVFPRTGALCLTPDYQQASRLLHHAPNICRSTCRPIRPPPRSRTRVRCSSTSC